VVLGDKYAIVLATLIQIKVTKRYLERISTQDMANAVPTVPEPAQVPSVSTELVTEYRAEKS